MIAICRRFCCPEGVKELDILNILKSLDANKAHGYDDISIRLLKLLQKSILKQLKTIKTYFEYCLRIRLFPDLWKKANVVFCNLLSPHQSGFIPGDSCVQQLISITHEIYNAFDCNPSLEVRGVFLDISKAFDKVWHDGLIYKLKRNGITGDLLRPIDSFLSDRY